MVVAADGRGSGHGQASAPLMWAAAQLQWDGAGTPSRRPARRHDITFAVEAGVTNAQTPSTVE